MEARDIIDLIAERMEEARVKRDRCYPTGYLYSQYNAEYKVLGRLITEIADTMFLSYRHQEPIIESQN